MGDLPSGQQESERSTGAVGERVDLNLASASQANDRLRVRPFDFSAAAMGVHRGRTDQNLRGRSASLSERLEQPDPNTLRCPALETIVEDLLQPADLAQCVRPTSSGFQHLNDFADHPLFVHARLAPRIDGQMGAIFANQLCVSQK